MVRSQVPPHSPRGFASRTHGSATKTLRRARVIPQPATICGMNKGICNVFFFFLNEYSFDRK